MGFIDDVKRSFWQIGEENRKIKASNIINLPVSFKSIYIVMRKQYPNLTVEQMQYELDSAGNNIIRKTEHGYSLGHDSQVEKIREYDNDPSMNFNKKAWKPMANNRKTAQCKREKIKNYVEELLGYINNNFDMINAFSSQQQSLIYAKLYILLSGYTLTHQINNTLIDDIVASYQFIPDSTMRDILLMIFEVNNQPTIEYYGDEV